MVRKFKSYGTQMTAGQELLPSVSGVKYKIHTLLLQGQNTAACASKGFYIIMKDELGQDVNIALNLIPSVANLNHVELYDLEIVTRSGSPVLMSPLTAAPDQAVGIFITYDELQA